MKEEADESKGLSSGAVEPNADAGGVGTDGGNLLDGEFDEEKAKAEFQAALMAWRKGEPTEEEGE